MGSTYSGWPIHQTHQTIPGVHNQLTLWLAGEYQGMTLQNYCRQSLDHINNYMYLISVYAKNNNREHLFGTFQWTASNTSKHLSQRDPQAALVIKGVGSPGMRHIQHQKQKKKRLV